MDYFNPAFYQNVPTNQVNWAQLAQQWVQYRQPEPIHMGYPAPMRPPQPTHPHQPQPVRPPFSGPYNSYGGAPFAGGPRMPPAGPGPYGHPPAGPPMGGYPPGPGMNQPPRVPYWQPTPRAPVPRPVAPVGPPKVNGEEEEYKAFYDPSLTIEEEPEQPEGGAMSHWITGTADAPPGPSWNHPPPWMMPPTTASIPPLMPEIDHHVRKKLPAWILEGLEKAEKEKHKKEEKERQEKEAEEAMKAREAERLAKGLGKFDSDSDDEQDSNGSIPSSNGKGSHPSDGEPVFLKNRKGHADEPRDDDASSDDEMTLEERKENALRAIRRIMTSVLLEASGNEMRRAARDVLDHKKGKAKPKILARSSALAALASLGGEDDEDSSSDADSSAGESSHGGRSPLPEKQVSRSPRSSETEKRTDESVFKAPLLPIKKQAGEKPNGNDSQPTGEKHDTRRRDSGHGHSPGQSSENAVSSGDQENSRHGRSGRKSSSPRRHDEHRSGKRRRSKSRSRSRERGHRRSKSPERKHRRRRHSSSDSDDDRSHRRKGDGRKRSNSSSSDEGIRHSGRRARRSRSPRRDDEKHRRRGSTDEKKDKRHSRD